jgi:hypothetical protein
MKPQSFERHAKIVPPYHYVMFPILGLNLLWAIWRVIVGPGIDSAMALLMSIALVLMGFYARVFALRVQDRVIRLEMRTRLAMLLPKDQLASIDALSPRQCVALRFASDAELPGLVAEVVRTSLQDPKAIKRMIKNWTADHSRA